MLFNSLDFAVFLPVVLVLYWLVLNDNIRFCLGLNWKQDPRLAFYYALLLVIYIFTGTPQEFIYFQF